MKNRKRIAILIISFLLILFGSLIYLFLNQNAFASSIICGFIPIPHLIIKDELIATAIKYYAADFLWSASFTLVIQAIVFLKRNKVALLLICCLLGFIYEGLQFIGFAKGNADNMDCLIYLIGSAFGIIVVLGGKLYEEE